MSQDPVRHNIELKARLASLDGARSIARAVATEFLGIEEQTDTYFTCRTGRLKLREIGCQRAELIWYSRPDRPTAKDSRYVRVDVPDGMALKQALTAAHGVWRVVAKQREIYLWNSVRIHLDQVLRLGNFLEFEAVLDPGTPAADGYAAVDWLMRQFGLATVDLLSGSYADMGPEQLGDAVPC